MPDPLVRAQCRVCFGMSRRHLQRHPRRAAGCAPGDKNPLVRQKCSPGSLGSLGTPFRQGCRTCHVPSPCGRRFRTEDSFVKRDAASSFVLIDNSDKVHDLVKELLPQCYDANSEVRRAALNVLVRVVNDKDRDAIPGLAQCPGER